MLLMALGQRSTGSCPSGTQLSPQDSCLGWGNVDVENDQLRVPNLRFYGKFFQLRII